jgi:hypothetical protein
MRHIGRPEDKARDVDQTTKFAVDRFQKLEKVTNMRVGLRRTSFPEVPKTHHDPPGSSRDRIVSLV